MAVRLALALALAVAGSAAAQTSPGPVPSIPTVTSFSQLPAVAPVGGIAYVTDCRALAIAAGVLALQLSGAGTGCLATYSGSVWQIDGTAIPVSR